MKLPPIPTEVSSTPAPRDHSYHRLGWCVVARIALHLSLLTITPVWRRLVNSGAQNQGGE